MVIKAVVWDLDGTLIHFKIDYIRARREAIKILIQYGVSKHILSKKESILDTIRKSREFFENSGYDPKKVEVVIKRVDQKVIEIEYEAAVNAEALNGIEQVLDYVRKNKLKQAVYTYNTHNNAKISLETVNLIQYFNIIIGRDDIKNPKPHPDHLLMICNKQDVKPTETIVIGDTWRDIKGAIDVSAFSIALETKVSKISTSPNIKYFYKADKIIKGINVSKSLLDLIEAIKELLRF